MNHQQRAFWLIHKWLCHCIPYCPSCVPFRTWFQNTSGILKKTTLNANIKHFSHQIYINEVSSYRFNNQNFNITVSNLVSNSWCNSIHARYYSDLTRRAKLTSKLTSRFIELNLRVIFTHSKCELWVLTSYLISLLKVLLKISSKVFAKATLTTTS